MTIGAFRVAGRQGRAGWRQSAHGHGRGCSQPPELSRLPRGRRLVLFATGLSWLGLLGVPQADESADD
jgi:hypothetical protein